LVIQRVSSKWAKTKVLLKNEHISPYIPTTCKYSSEALTTMLNEFTMVFLKPDCGTYGRGVMCIEQLTLNNLDSDDQFMDTYTIYQLRYNTETKIFNSLEALFIGIHPYTRHHNYLIQQGIPLLQYNSCPFDLRVLTQKSPNGQWVSTGIIGRVAAPHKVVTNHHSGGKVQTFETLMSAYMTPMEVFDLQQSLKSLGVSVANQLQKKYHHIKELGLDIAMDNNKTPWILEVNTLPALYPFKKYISNKDVYRRIYRYAVSYGRYSSKKTSR